VTILPLSSRSSKIFSPVRLVIQTFGSVLKSRSLRLVSIFFLLWRKRKYAYEIPMLSVYPWIPPYLLLNAWTYLYETWYAYHGTQAHFNGVLMNPSHKSVCLCMCLSLLARQLLDNNVTDATNRHATIKLLEASFSMQSVSYGKKVGRSFFPELLICVLVVMTVLIFIRGWVDPRTRVWLEGLGKLKKSTEFSWGVKGGRRVGLTTLPPSMSRMSRDNVGASTSHNPMGLHGLLQG
jgi:hypothetical protein